MINRFFLALVLAFFAVFLKPAHAQSDWLVAEIEKAQPGATILIPPGTYELSDQKITKDLTLVGDKSVLFSSPTSVQKGILNPVGEASLRIENVTFSNATAPDKNGAGIRHDGKNLDVVNCRFINNENGILATGKPTGTIRIQNSKFIDNGYGDGYSHGVYMSHGDGLIIDSVKFSGTKIGHHVKSLARTTIIKNSHLDDAEGRTSYSIDTSRGGNVTIDGNTFSQSASSDNSAIINYDLSRGGDATALKITNNTFINYHRSGVLLRNETPLRPVTSNNQIFNKPGGKLDLRSLTNGVAPNPPASALDRLKGMLDQIREEREPVQQNAPDPKDIVLEQIEPMGKTSQLIKAPEISGHQSALFSFRVENTTRTDFTKSYQTFAQPLPPGKFFRGPVVALFNDQKLPAQIDIKARHKDGSVRHAIFTVSTPPIKKRSHLVGHIISANEKIKIKGLFDARAILTQFLECPVKIDVKDHENRTFTFEENLRAAAISAMNNSFDEYWLDGDLVKEFRIEKQIVPHLQLRVDIRIFRDGTIRLSSTFANDKTFSPGLRNLSYTVSIGDPSAPALLAENVQHHRASEWRKTFWLGTNRNLHVARDTIGLYQSGAVLPLDGSIGIRRAVIASNLSTVQKNTAPLHEALITKYFPQSGGRSDIGIYPKWTANYIITQNQAAFAIMLANAEAGGAVPWHFYDENTRKPVRIDHHPKFWGEQRGLESRYEPNRPHPDLFDGHAGGWSIDHSHKPDLFYIPYLMTGDRVFADRLSMQAAYAISGRWPTLREGGLKAIDVEQLRSSAWSLRDISNASYILPDNDPMRAYFKKVLDQNLSAMEGKYVAKRMRKNAGDLEGYFDEYISRDPERISPWQNDFVDMALWQVVRQHGHQNAISLLNWSANFQAGRFLTQGYGIERSPAYKLNARHAQSREARTTWKEVIDATFDDATLKKSGMDGYPDYGAGYIGSGYGALGAIFNATQSIAALEAFSRLAQATRRLGLWSADVDGSIARNNGFIFALELGGNKLLSRDTFFKTSSQSSTFQIGSNKKDTLNGSSMSDVLVGNNGADILDGLEGDDFIFGGNQSDKIRGGDGNDRLVAGNGDDELTGGDGRDVFIFRRSDTGKKHITDFNLAEDRIGFLEKIGDPPPLLADLKSYDPNSLRLANGDTFSITIGETEMSDLTQGHIIAVQ